MKKYLKPELDVLELNVLDVIQASKLIDDGTGDFGGDGGETPPEMEFSLGEMNYLGKQ